MCIRDRYQRRVRGSVCLAMASNQIARLARGVQTRGFHSTKPASWKTYAFSPVKTNQPVEKFAAWREDIEKSFRSNSTTTLRLALFALCVPAAVFTMASGEFNETDRSYGHDNGTTSRGNKKEYC
eukprot:TRINITY_DN1939_c0_g1_i1.p1 TRINITY_DN1939_c0_g1~~TRINITY_DN1939_c0_g1_i1.p1  ORF type:complete len:125 (+),score=32.05 TRINITY_DN1939_c0_g1_i1:92-466(+)